MLKNLTVSNVKGYWQSENAEMLSDVNFAKLKVKMQEAECQNLIFDGVNLSNQMFYQKNNDERVRCTLVIPSVDLTLHPSMLTELRSLLE